MLETRTWLSAAFAGAEHFEFHKCGTAPENFVSALNSASDSSMSVTECDCATGGAS